MTAPSNAGGPPKILDANKEVNPNNNPESPKDSTEDVYLVKCPQTISVLHDPEGRFPDVTPDGTEMTVSQKDAAKKSASESWMILKSQKIQRGDK